MASIVVSPNGASALLTNAQDARSSKYLFFHLAGQQFGIRVLNVREIIGVPEISGIPQMPAHVKGLINLRGCVIPIVDLRLKFGLDAAALTPHSCVIVVQIRRPAGAIPIGILVDGVSEVMTLGPNDLQDIPDFGEDVDTQFLLGIAKCNRKVNPLLDIEKVLTAHELRGLASLLENGSDQPTQ